MKPMVYDPADEIIQRLRAGQTYDYETGNPRDMSSTMEDAADEIEKLRAALTLAVFQLNQSKPI